MENDEHTYPSRPLFFPNLKGPTPALCGWRHVDPGSHSQWPARPRIQLDHRERSFYQQRGFLSLVKWILRQLSEVSLFLLVPRASHYR